jgi:Na+-translocating ferredoxin:NAD+ oxidoreductase RnfG subunit
VLAVASLQASLPAFAVVLQSQEEALQAAFPEATVERHTAFLDDDQVARIRSLAGSEPSSRVVNYYRGIREDRMVGTAYFDGHRVRTLPEVLMVVVGPEGTVKRVSVLSFLEPKDYLPRQRWLDQFQGRALEEGLSLKREIRGITGATLSARAVTDAVRRALALHQVLNPAADEEERVPEEKEDRP